MHSVKKITSVSQLISQVKLKKFSDATVDTSMSIFFTISHLNMVMRKNVEKKINSFVSL